MEANFMSPKDALPRIQAILNEGLPCRLLVTGTSMLPFLRDKTDTVILTPLSKPVRRGDILFYLRGPEFCVLHRVQRVCSDDVFLICGDAQVALEPVRREQVLGIVSHIQRGSRLISCGSPLLRISVALWQLLRPIRPYLMAILRRLHMI